ncbi:type IV pilin protein [Candidatus Avelusimicrobium caledoniensis]|uniref:type IV pilin protein n=1 Tax=Candidatus Avelusimicrobium caledoniensis TaxID=3416220 RepID=UPI003D0EAAB6
MKHKRAFTLIELLVVVLIIGILAAVAVPQYRLAVSKSRFVQLQLLVDQVSSAQEALYLAQGSYTTDVEVLSVSFPQAQSVSTNNGQVTLTYDWGTCSFDVTQMSCKNENIGLYYHRYFEHEPNSTTIHAGKQRECSAKIGQSIPNQICQQVTGKKTPFWNNGVWAAYAY